MKISINAFKANPAGPGGQAANAVTATLLRCGPPALRQVNASAPYRATRAAIANIGISAPMPKPVPLPIGATADHLLLSALLVISHLEP